MSNKLVTLPYGKTLCLAAAVTFLTSCCRCPCPNSDVFVPREVEHKTVTACRGETEGCYYLQNNVVRGDLDQEKTPPSYEAMKKQIQQMSDAYFEQRSYNRRIIPDGGLNR